MPIKKLSELVDLVDPLIAGEVVEIAEAFLKAGYDLGEKKDQVSYEELRGKIMQIYHVDEIHIDTGDSWE